MGKLNEISIDQDILDGTASDIQDHDLLPISGVIDYVDTDRLFQNVKHEKINNSILIKSVIEE
ncbi:TPA: hypothetical protein DEP21_04125 [Patescibacteria group bacterium]|nr:hypothetical protein [Candidatus Gracilibacteria bacterium]